MKEGEFKMAKAMEAVEKIINVATAAKYDAEQVETGVKSGSTALRKKLQEIRVICGVERKRISEESKKAKAKK